jgi:hypothetical protein
MAAITCLRVCQYPRPNDASGNPHLTAEKRLRTDADDGPVMV